MIKPEKIVENPTEIVFFNKIPKVSIITQFDGQEKRHYKLVMTKEYKLLLNKD